VNSTSGVGGTEGGTGVPIAGSAAPRVRLPPPVSRGRQLRSGAVGLYRVLRANPLSFVGFVLVAFTLILAAFVVFAPHLVAHYGAEQQTGVYNSAPTLFRWPPSFAHPFGTDGASYDIFSEVMLALPTDLGIGVAIAGVALIAGGGLGLVAGFWDRPGHLSGYTSSFIMRVTDVFLAFPSLILALALVASIGKGTIQAMIAIMLTWWPYYVRLVRGEVIAVKHLPYVTAARAAGVRETKILTRHVLRNVLEPVVVYFTLDIGTVLVIFSTISFVGVGVPYPSSAPEWGSMMSFYQGNYPFQIYWWAITFPALAIFVTVLAFSLLGDGLRDVLDPRSRRALAESAAHEPPPEANVGEPPVLTLPLGRDSPSGSAALGGAP
jgi:peptide/nickel transport system permease protein